MSPASSVMSAAPSTRAVARPSNTRWNSTRCASGSWSVLATVAIGGDVKPHGARNSALKNVAPAKDTVRSTSDSTSRCTAPPPFVIGKVFWTFRKDGPPHPNVLSCPWPITFARTRWIRTTSGRALTCRVSRTGGQYDHTKDSACEGPHSAGNHGPPRRHLARSRRASSAVGAGPWRTHACRGSHGNGAFPGRQGCSRGRLCPRSVRPVRHGHYDGP